VTNKPVAVRLFGLSKEVESRTQTGGNISESIRRDLGRYYCLMRAELGGIGLTRNEACAVMDACNGLWMDDGTFSPSYIRVEVEDAIRLEGLDRKWEIDGPALLAKLQDLTISQAYALADAITQFWARPEQDVDEKLREIGLIKGARSE
jgi:hypothetical protein